MCFNHQNLTLIYDVVLYYKFPRSDAATRTLAKDPENWVKEDFELWIDQGCHSTTASADPALSVTTANTTIPPAKVCPDTKKAENAWMSWQRSRRDHEKYPVLPNNREYTDWYVLIKRQFEEDRCTRVIDDSFKDTMIKWGPDDTLLYNAQLNHMSIVLEHVLQTTDGKRFTRRHKNNRREIWKLHELHQRSSTTNATITIALSQELANLKVVNFDSSTQCLDTFDSKLEKFNEISQDVMPAKMATSFLMAATLGLPN